MQGSCMSVRAGKIQLVMGAVLLACSHAPPGSATENSVTTTNFVVTYQTIAREQAEKFAAEAEKDYAAVTSYLGRRYSRPIRVYISDNYAFPRYRKEVGKIFIPTDRFPLAQSVVSKAQRRGTGLLISITPIIAPSANTRWGDFLETGLRTHIQEKFGRKEEQPFPTMGRDLHEETAQLVSDYGKFIPLANAEEARTWRTRPTRTRRLAYLEAGSFVRYLIEQQGLEKFLQWYDGGRFEDVYTRPLSAIEQEWQRYVESLGR